MSKFKKGDKVTDGDAVYEITDVDDGVYKWRPVGGKGDPSYSDGGEVEWAERKMRLANSRACNAKFKIGEWVEFNIPGVGKRLGSIDEIKGGEYYIEDPKLGVTHIIEEKDIVRTVVPVSQTWGNAEPPVSTNSVVRNAMAANARTARNASDADVARYLAAAKDRIRAEVVALKDVAGLLKMEPVPPSAEKAYAKVVKAMASLQKAFAELS